MRRYFLIVPLLVATFAGCAGNPPDKAAPDPTCILYGPDRPPSDRAQRVAVLMENVEVLDAPWPYNTGTPLLEADCLGRIHPGLARVSKGSGRHFVLTLNDSARDYDGARITAPEVARIWRMYIEQGAGVDSVRALNDRQLEVFLERPALMTLVDQVFAVPAREWDPRHMRWLLKGGPEPRTSSRVSTHELLDELSGADLMVVGDPAVAEYATNAGMAVAALPHTRTFVLLVPSVRGRQLSRETQADLAAAVRGASARASETPAWWRNDLDECGTLTPQPDWMVHKPVSYTGADYVYFEETDAVARDLAERIVALAAMDTAQSMPARGMVRALKRDGSMPLETRGVHTWDLDFRLLRGEGFAFVTSVNNPVADSCWSARLLLRRATWLAHGGAAADAIIPLVDTHAYVILAHREVVVTFDMYGTLRVLEPGNGLP